MLVLTNCHIFNGDEFTFDKSIIIDKEKIKSIVPNSNIPEGYETIDLGGKIVAPGFIDIQVNGGGGVLFNNTPTLEGIECILSTHLSFGTTSLLPTFISDSLDYMKMAANAVNDCLKNKIPGILGIHFEGPFLSSEKAGAHNKKFIRKVNKNDLDVILSIKGGIRLFTIAPEIIDDKTLSYLLEKNILLSLGHSKATYNLTTNALNKGVKSITHLFNAMSPLCSRSPGVVGAALDHQESWCSIIVDGYHVDYASVRIAHSAKADRKMILVTDSMPPAGVEDYMDSYVLNGKKVDVIEGKCVDQNGSLAGSSLTMIKAVQNCISNVGLAKEEALRMASTYPAELLGVSDKYGFVKVGYIADLVVLDNEMNISYIIKNGNIVER